MNRPLLSRSIFIKDHIITWYRYLVKKTYSVVRILLALEIWVLTIKVMPMRWMKDFTIDGAFFILLLLLPNYIHLDIVENLLPIFFLQMNRNDRFFDWNQCIENFQTESNLLLNRPTARRNQGLFVYKKSSQRYRSSFDRVFKKERDLIAVFENDRESSTCWTLAHTRNLYRHSATLNGIANLSDDFPVRYHLPGAIKFFSQNYSPFFAISKLILLPF